MMLVNELSWFATFAAMVMGGRPTRGRPLVVMTFPNGSEKWRYTLLPMILGK